jgi:hypothetical protein
MIWSAILEDNSKILEYNNGVETKFDNVDKSKIKSFKIFENVDDMNVSFSANTGIVKFPNFDLEQLKTLNDGQPINVVYDVNTQSFKMTDESLKLYNQLLLKEEKFYNFIEIEENGIFNISGDKFYLSLNTNGETINFIDQLPYNDIIHYKEASVDFIGNSNSFAPRKKIERVNAYVIGFNKNHRHKQLQINLSLKLIYNIANKCIVFEGIITCDSTVQGDLQIHYGTKVSTLSATFMKDVPTRVDRLVTLI